MTSADTNAAADNLLEGLLQRGIEAVGGSVERGAIALPERDARRGGFVRSGVDVWQPVSAVDRVARNAACCARSGHPAAPAPPRRCAWGSPPRCGQSCAGRAWMRWQRRRRRASVPPSCGRGRRKRCARCASCSSCYSASSKRRRGQRRSSGVSSSRDQRRAGTLTRSSSRRWRSAYASCSASRTSCGGARMS